MYLEQYSNGRKKVTQIISHARWKKVYAMYIEVYHEDTLQVEALKEHLRECLQELKMERLNPGGGLSTCLQSNQVLGKLKQIDGHV